MTFHVGVDSIWTWDHFFPRYGDPDAAHFEGWTILTAMAADTTHSVCVEVPVGRATGNVAQT